MEPSVEIAIIGFGTVGTGVVKILQDKTEQIYRKTGVKLELAHVVDTDLKRDRQVKPTSGQLHDDLNKVLADKEVTIAAELVGGTTVAADIIKKLLAAGKDVVTANKALLAERGEDIFAAARQYGRCVSFEASCVGGVPVIGALRTGLAANRISAIYGIVNGTCNYILSGMSSEGKDYATALQEAQEAGYAEADPTLDVGGFDSAHKAAILSLLAFGQIVDFKAIAVQGIEKVHLEDIRYGQELGYKMKLLAIAEQTEMGLSPRVHPAFISQDEALAQVSGPFNALSVFGDAAGRTTYLGRGAGMMPTASAVVADIIETARGNAGRNFAMTAGLGRPCKPASICSPAKIYSPFYLRITATEQPELSAEITRILDGNGISISECMEREGKGDGDVTMIVITNRVRQGDMEETLEELSKLEMIKSEPVCIPVITLPSDE